jgi:hypothetical protein
MMKRQLHLTVVLVLAALAALLVHLAQLATSVGESDPTPCGDAVREV